MSDLTVTIVQANVYWEDRDKNLLLFDRLLLDIDSTTDLVVLPELFNTGFTMNVKNLAESMEGKTVQWMADKAKSINAVITGSVIILENSHYYNRLIWMRPDQTFTTYDKRHLFRMANEHQTYSAGNERLTVSLNEWQICPQVCYDLRFPVWNRNKDDYDCFIIVANWPDIRSDAWKLLLQARATENISYVIGVNRVGNDGNGVYHSGYSSCFDPQGGVMMQEKDVEGAYTTTLSKNFLDEARKRFPAFLDADKFHIDTSGK